MAMAGITDNNSIARNAAAGNTPATATVVPYHERLNQDRGWALSEGSLFFEGKGKVQEALRRIIIRLNELGIPSRSNHSLRGIERNQSFKP
jgi:hypothetical protein